MSTPMESIDIDYRVKHDFGSRQREAGRIREKFPDKVPVICQAESRTVDRMGQLAKKKYLVPGTMSVGEFQLTIRQGLRLSADRALYLYVNSMLLPVSATMAAVYQAHHEDDGFLYATYAGEVTFGDTVWGDNYEVVDMECDDAMEF